MTSCALALCASACTFADSEGEPWGQLVFEPPTATFDIADRQVEQTDRFRVGNGYELELVSLELELGALRVDLAPEGTGAVDFDPANPPAGYSLCHNGHCHADDGRLVDYEDIALELSTAGGVASSVLQVIDRPVEFGDGATVTVSLDPELCQQDCTLPFGDLTRVVLAINAVHLDARVFDTRAPESARLPEDGVEVKLSLEDPREFATLIEGRVSKDSTGDFVITPALEISGALFDGIDWQIPGTWNTSFAKNLAEESSFDASVVQQ